VFTEQVRRATLYAHPSTSRLTYRNDQLFGAERTEPDSVRRANRPSRRQDDRSVKWPALASCQLLVENMRRRRWGEREFGRAAVIAGVVHLVFLRVRLTLSDMACRPRSPYQVLG
jgi:hypothetical protein